eukprot:scaffold44539_cov54-Phaeocystis_antarctica.AAC.2
MRLQRGMYHAPSDSSAVSAHKSEGIFQHLQRGAWGPRSQHKGQYHQRRFCGSQRLRVPTAEYSQRRTSLQREHGRFRILAVEIKRARERRVDGMVRGMARSSRDGHGLK